MLLWFNRLQWLFVVFMVFQMGFLVVCCLVMLLGEAEISGTNWCDCFRRFDALVIAVILG